MEFSETAKANAAKFLEKLSASTASPNDCITVLMDFKEWRIFELEAACLDFAKSFLARMACPGILSYHISGEACRRLISKLDSWYVPPAAENTSTEKDEPQNTEKLYDGQTIAGGVIEEIVSVAKEWAGCLPCLTAPADKVDISIFAIKNSRRKMEDRHAVCVDVNSLYGLKDYPHQAYYAVFDGHIGAEAARYASVTLLYNLVSHPDFKDKPESALKQAIKITDDNCCSKNLPRSGSTAVACLIRGDKLYTGWVGDSQAMIVRRGVPTQLVVPHKPDQVEEQKRIEEAGGVVLWNGAWRVNGNLSVSRAIGDAPDKPFVSGEGDTISTDLDGTEDYLMLACDGVWDVLTMEDIVECVNKHLTCPDGSRATVTKAIIQKARSEGSGDNMTVIVSFFSSFVQPTVPVVEETSPASVESPPQDSGASVESPPQDSGASVESPPQDSGASVESPPQETNEEPSTEPKGTEIKDQSTREEATAGSYDPETGQSSGETPR